MVAQLQHIFVRHKAAAVDQAGDLFRQQTVKHLFFLIRLHLLDILLLHKPDDLNPVPVKMVKKTGQLQSGAVHIRMAHHRLLHVDLRSQVFQLHLLYHFRNGHSIHVLVLLFPSLT